MRILGLVILYHPNAEQLASNIQSYLPFIDQLMVVQNSAPAIDGLDRLPGAAGKVVEHRNNRNEGIARPLNQAATFGLAHQFDWLLTMDQDSFFPPGEFEQMCRNVLDWSGPIPGIFSPTHVTATSPRHERGTSPSSVRFVLGSGSLLNLAAFGISGPYEEKLFIDSVDHEYCLRLRKRGFEVIRLNDVFLQHSIGTPIVLAGKPISVSHSPQRKYFITRNRFYVMFRYIFFDPLYFIRECIEFAKDLARIVFLEDQKLKKLSAVARGTWHFLIQRFNEVPADSSKG